MAHIIASILATIAILYVCGGICFLYFRFSQAETESRMRNFLESHRAIFLGRNPALREAEVTKQTIRSYGRGGWNMIGLSYLCLMFSKHWSFWTVLVSSGPLFFGGLFFAYSWYALRCLRLLGLESIKGPFDGSTPPFKTGEMLLAQNKKLFAISAIIVALGIFSGYFYLTITWSAPLPPWMLLLDFVLYALFLYALWNKLLKN